MMLDKNEIMIYSFPIIMGLFFVFIAIITENYYILLIIVAVIIISTIILIIQRNSPITQESKSDP